jgi:hypothetical protein
LQQLNKRIENNKDLRNNKTNDKGISRESKSATSTRLIYDQVWDENTPWRFDSENSELLEDYLIDKIQEQVTLRQTYRNKQVKYLIPILMNFI